MKEQFLIDHFYNLWTQNRRIIPLRYLRLSEDRRVLEIKAALPSNNVLKTLDSNRLNEGWLSRSHPIELFCPVQIHKDFTSYMAILVHYAFQFSLWFPDGDEIKRIPVIIKEEIVHINICAFEMDDFLDAKSFFNIFVAITKDGNLYTLSLVDEGSELSCLKIKLPISGPIERVKYIRMSNSLVYIALKGPKMISIVKLSPNEVAKIVVTWEYDESLVDFTIFPEFKNGLSLLSLICLEDDKISYEQYENLTDPPLSSETIMLPLNFKAKSCQVSEFSGLCLVVEGVDRILMYRIFENVILLDEPLDIDDPISDIFVDGILGVHLITSKGYFNSPNTTKSMSWTFPLPTKEKFDFIAAFDILQPFPFTGEKLNNSHCFNQLISNVVQSINIKSTFSTWQSLRQFIDFINESTSEKVWKELLILYLLIIGQPERVVPFAINYQIMNSRIREAEVYVAIDQGKLELASSLLYSSSLRPRLEGVDDILGNNLSFVDKLRELLGKGLVRDTICLIKPANIIEKELGLKELLAYLSRDLGDCCSAGKTSFLCSRFDEEEYKLISKIALQSNDKFIKKLVLELFLNSRRISDVMSLADDLSVPYNHNDLVPYQNDINTELLMIFDHFRTFPGLERVNNVEEDQTLELRSIPATLPFGGPSQPIQPPPSPKASSTGTKTKHYPKLPSRLATIVQISEPSLTASPTSNNKDHSEVLTDDFTEQLEEESSLKTPKKQKHELQPCTPIRHSPRLLEKSVKSSPEEHSPYNVFEHQSPSKSPKRTVNQKEQAKVSKFEVDGTPNTSPHKKFTRASPRKPATPSGDTTDHNAQAPTIPTSVLPSPDLSKITMRSSSKQRSRSRRKRTKSVEKLNDSKEATAPEAPKYDFRSPRKTTTNLPAKEEKPKGTKRRELENPKLPSMIGHNGKSKEDKRINGDVTSASTISKRSRRTTSRTKQQRSSKAKRLKIESN